MSKALVIVESPAKARTINKFLGSEFVVRASMGHVRDLPAKVMGVDIQRDFKPQYVVIPGRRKILNQLKKEAKGKENLYLAPDPDREGEAICWHLANTVGKDMKVHRVEFNEITKAAVQEAFRNPRDIDMNRVDAQQARRILDRIVGYSLSPLLWRKVGRGLSAGRVQSVAVKLIVEREREIQAFVPQEYWEIEAELKKKSIMSSNVQQSTEKSTVHNVQQSTEKDKKAFIAKLEKIYGQKPEIKNKEQAQQIVAELDKENSFLVASVKESQKKRRPAPPFTTSKLQQEAFNKLRFPARRTMRVAQQLYEGIELEEEGSVGLITYMRTDSVRVSNEAIGKARGFILDKYGKQYLPAKPNVYRSKKRAQEAHEAIRPTYSEREPQSLKKFLTQDQFKLYELIWSRFLASQMTPAVYALTTVDINAAGEKYLFRANGTKCIFQGFTIIYGQEQKEVLLPSLSPGEPLDLINLTPSQHFTKPPPRYSDGTLVKALEEKGIGRPSTYAPIIETIVTRDYIRRQAGYLYPTELGTVVTELLVKYFPRILNVKFTAEIEEELDEIEKGRLNWVKVLKIFYEPFSKNLSRADLKMKSLKKEAIFTSEVCAVCGKPMVIKWGRRGKFLSCSGFPECKYAKSISTGVKCPQPGCDGELIERRSKRGRSFYGCSNYPKCKYIARRLPQGS